MNNKKLIYCLSSDSDVGARAHWVLQRNYQVEHFQDQESFIEAVTQIEPDLVILDTESHDLSWLMTLTKKDCGQCIAYLLVTPTSRRPFSALFQCNCVVGQVSNPIIPDQLQNAVQSGMELSHMCKIRSNIFKKSIHADQIDLVMQCY